MKYVAYAFWAFLALLVMGFLPVYAKFGVGFFFGSIGMAILLSDD
jgi:hypothetical protein